jgi:NADPH:quinone reductase
LNGNVAMKALLCKTHGLPDTLVFEEHSLGPVGPDQVLINMKAAGVNFPDVLIIQNKYQFKPDLPFSPGSEMAGVVAEVGADVKHVKVGDKVMASTGHGAFAEQVLVAANKVLPMPPEMDFVTAAAFTLTYGTSHHALKDRGALKAGETLLVLGAAGGVGLAAIEIGKALGAKVIAAASTAEKLAVCKEHGADEVINYSSEDFRERVKALTGGKGPDVIYDPVGGPLAEQAFRSIGWRGRYLVIGFANGEIPKLPFNLMLLKGAAVVGVFWGDFTKREPKQNYADIQEMLGWMREGKIRPHISAQYPLAQGAQALNDMMNRKVMGKVVVTN